MPSTSSATQPTRLSAPLLIVLLVAGLLPIGLSAAFPSAGSASAKLSGSPGKIAPGLPRGSRIPWQDGSYFLAGVNYPQYLYYGGDIATLSSVDPDCNWAYSSSFDYTAIDADFADLQAHGAHVVRWWLFGDGRGSPEFDLNRRVTGFDATFFDHMDQAMEIAARHNIYIIWSLWDFLAFEHGNWLCGGTGMAQAYAEAVKMPPALRDAFLAHLKLAQAAPSGMLPGAGPAGGQSCMINAGGHRNLVTDISPGGAQDSFFNNALIPMLQRYAANRNIIGWEIMNEPEWALNINPYTQQNPTVQEPVDVAQMRTFFARFTQAVHTYAPTQYATVGSASLKFMGFGQYLQSGIWNGLSFDYYGAHYYGWMDSTFNNGSPMTIDYNTTQQQLDAPVVIGELPANGGTAPVYLPSVRRSATETSTLALRYICTAYAPGGDPPCTRPYTTTVEYDNPNGTAALSQTVVLPPYGGWTGLVPAGTGSFAGAARVLSNGPIAAAITQTGILSASEQTAYTGQDQANLTVWLPRITNQGTHRSRIAVQNTGVHTATATIRYYDAAGTAAATDILTLAPRGSALVDPLLPGSPPGPPAGFQGSAIIIGSRPLVATAYELDPQLGSDAYNGEGQGYQHAVYLPSVRNWGADGTPALFVQNPCCAAAQVVVSYYNSTGALAASQALSLPAYGSAVVDPRAVLTGGFEGAAIITSDQFPAAVMRSVTTSGPVSTTVLYAGTQNPDQRLHFPVVHRPNADGSGQVTSFSAHNVSTSSPITLWVTLNDNSGGTPYFSNAITVPPRGQWIASTTALPGVPAGFSGTAEILWPWPNGWNQGFPLLATARDLDSTPSHGSTYRGIASHTQYWAVTRYTPDQLLEGIYSKHWAGALAWSYYDQGTGNWDDFQYAMIAFDAAHPADVRIGQTLYTPVPTPGNGGTATALAATNTPAYGNGQTATAVAGLTGTPQPPCATCTVQFIDVPVGSTFYEFVHCLACGGIISGYPDGTFRPNNRVTRGQLSKIVSNAASYSEPHSEQTFEDVAPGSTFYDFVQRLYSRGIIAGYPCGGSSEPCLPPGNRPYFRPNANVTRGQSSKIVASASGLPAPPAGQRTFEDVAVGSTFWQWIEALASTGAISGYPCGGPGEACIPPLNRPYFRPSANVTRGQSSKIVSLTFFPGCNPLSTSR
jgi:hypothetical protein